MRMVDTDYSDGIGLTKKKMKHHHGLYSWKMVLWHLVQKMLFAM